MTATSSSLIEIWTQNKTKIGKDLLEIVTETGAKTIYPIHIENGVMFNKVSENRILIDVGKKYKI